MECLLGTSNSIEKRVENLIKYKIDMLDEEVTFGKSTYDAEYLVKLHEFLYGNVYEWAGQIRNGITEKDIEEINNAIETLVILSQCFVSDLYDEYLETIDYLKYMQMFKDGNKRTIYAFVKQLICAYRMPLELLPLCGYDDEVNLSEAGIKLKYEKNNENLL